MHLLKLIVLTVPMGMHICTQIQVQLPVPSWWCWYLCRGQPRGPIVPACVPPALGSSPLLRRITHGGQFILLHNQSINQFISIMFFFMKGFLLDCYGLVKQFIYFLATQDKNAIHFIFLLMFGMIRTHNSRGKDKNGKFSVILRFWSEV